MCLCEPRAARSLLGFPRSDRSKRRPRGSSYPVRLTGFVVFATPSPKPCCAELPASEQDNALYLRRQPVGSTTHLCLSPSAIDRGYSSIMFGKKTPTNVSAPKAGPQLAMLALKSGKGLSAKAIIKAWSELFPGVPPISDDGTEKKDGSVVVEFGFDGGSLMLLAVNAPIPQPEIDEACGVSWMWRQASSELKQQRAHAIITAVTSVPPVDAALAVTRLVAAAAKAGDPAGVYWGAGGHVHSPALFIDAAKSFGDAEMLPVMLWVGLRISGSGPKGPLTLTTHGLAPFGHNEIEIIDTRMGIGDLRTLVFETCDYLLRAGPVLRHGHTFGRSEDEQLRVEHTTSRFRTGEPVIRLHVP